MIFLYYLFYVWNEKFIRYWDYLGCWSSTVNVSNIFSEDVGNVIKGLASSVEYNESIIASYYMPNMKIQNMIYNVNCIDLRDGFPQQFLKAKYVIVVDPIQYHMKPSDQRTIGIIAEAILNEPIINKHYEIENIDEGVNNEKIYYLRQVIPLDNEAKQFFVSQFDKYYADYRNLFKDRIN